MTKPTVVTATTLPIRSDCKEKNELNKIKVILI